MCCGFVATQIKFISFLLSVCRWYFFFKYLASSLVEHFHKNLQCKITQLGYLTMEHNLHYRVPDMIIEKVDMQEIQI